MDDFSPTFILMTIVAAAVVIGGMAGLFVLLNRNERKRQALRIISGSAVEAAGGDASGKKLKRADLSRKLQQSEKEKTKKGAVLADRLKQAGWSHIPVKHYRIGAFAFGAVLVLLLKIASFSVPILLLSFIVGTLGLPRFALKFAAGRRQKKFLEEFPDALESMVRLLKAGMPIGEAVSMVSREFAGPVGEEMSKVYDEQKIGVSLAEACRHAADRMPITEMQMFATGIAIQQQTGSSLSEILTNLAKVIRARFRLRRKVEALSAEAKASAMIIGSLPILVGLGLNFVNPTYMDPLFMTVKGKFLLGGAVFWMACGVLVMRQMINFKV